MMEVIKGETGNILANEDPETIEGITSLHKL
jgi:hypothetical protein